VLEQKKISEKHKERENDTSKKQKNIVIVFCSSASFSNTKETIFPICVVRMFLAVCCCIVLMFLASTTGTWKS